MPTTQPTTVTRIHTKPTTNGHAPRSASSPPDEDRPAAPLPSPDPRRWWALAIIAVAQFVVIMDTSIIGVALPAIQGALGFAQAELSWVFNAYVIAFGGLLLLGGRLSDVFGASRIFRLGFVILTLGSLVTGLASSEAILLAGRAMQGVGSALIAPAALTMLMMLFSGQPGELPRALAFYAAAAPAGGTAGVFLGGLLTDGLDWRWVFLINVPIGLIVLLASRSLAPRALARRGRLDLFGALSITAALSLAVLGIVRAAELGWGSAETLTTLAAAALLLVLFVWLQKVQRDPLMPLAIWRAPNLAAANIVMMLLGAAWIPTWFFLNLYLQQVLGYGALAGGAALLPMTLTIMLLMIGVTGRVVGRFGFRSPLVVGMVVLAVGIGWLSLVPVGGTFVANVLLATLVAATGMSLAYIPAMLAALAGPRPEEGGLASGIVNTTYQVGSALGLAAMSAVAALVGAGSAGTTAGLVVGFQAAFVGAAALALAGAAVAALMIRSPSRGAQPAPGSGHARNPEPAAARELTGASRA